MPRLIKLVSSQVPQTQAHQTKTIMILKVHTGERVKCIYFYLESPGLLYNRDRLSQLINEKDPFALKMVHISLGYNRILIIFYFH